MRKKIKWGEHPPQFGNLGIKREDLTYEPTTQKAEYPSSYHK